MPCRKEDGKFWAGGISTGVEALRSGCYIPNFFVDNIHLLKTMTLELSVIQVLQGRSEKVSMAASGERLHVRNVDGGMESRLGGWLRLLSVGVDGREDWLGGIAGSVHGGANFLVGHDCNRGGGGKRRTVLKICG
jgi:hypothetical protein